VRGFHGTACGNAHAIRLRPHVWHRPDCWRQDCVKTPDESLRGMLRQGNSHDQDAGRSAWRGGRLNLCEGQTPKAVRWVFRRGGGNDRLSPQQQRPDLPFCGGVGKRQIFFPRRGTITRFFNCALTKADRCAVPP